VICTNDDDDVDALATMMIGVPRFPLTIPEAMRHTNAIQYEVDNPNAMIAPVDPNYHTSVICHVEYDISEYQLLHEMGLR
jgi:hypothetical protein